MYLRSTNPRSIKACLELRKTSRKLSSIRSLWGLLIHKLRKLVIREPRRNVKRVIMFAHSPLMVTYTLKYADVLLKQSELKVKVFVALTHMNGELITIQKNRCEKAGVSLVNEWTVPFYHWDLCVVADHSFADEMLDDATPILFTYHGLGSIKKHKGENYKYGDTFIKDKHGRYKYSKMLEAGTFQRDHALLIAPHLKDTIAIVGELDVDDFIRLGKERDKIRKDLGYGRDDTVILIQSTWGEASIECSLGESMFEACDRLTAERGYVFVLSTHPNHWGGRIGCADKSDYYLSHDKSCMKVLRPEEERLPYMVAADCCISDITTLATVFAFSKKPLIFYVNESAELDSESELAQIIKHCARIDAAGDIPGAVTRALQEPIANSMQNLMTQICSYPMESRDRIRALMLSMMNASSSC